MPAYTIQSGFEDKWTVGWGLCVFERGWPRPLVVHAARWAALCSMMRLS